MSAAEALPPDADPDVLLAEEAAALLRVHVNTLYLLVDERKIPHFRLGRRRLRFLRSSLVAWMSSQETGSSPGRRR